MANYEWTPIAYNEVDPQFSFATDDSNIATSLRNVNNIREFTQFAKSRYLWYVNRVSNISNAKRLVNLWYYWNFLTWAGYKYYPKSVLASLAWLVSGIASPWERRAGIKYYFMDTPGTIIETAGYRLPTYYLEPCGSNIWTRTSDQISYIYYANSVSNSNRIYFDDGSGILPNDAKAYNSNISQPSSCGFGLCQWTDWGVLRTGCHSANSYYGETSETRWDACYPYNVPLQCLFLNYCKILNDSGIIAAPGDYSFVKWQQIPDVDLAWTVSNPKYDCIEMSWNQYCNDYTLDFCRTHTMSRNWLADDEGKFKITARQWQALFNNAGSPRALIGEGEPINTENLRYDNYIQVIKPCFEYWDANEKAELLSMPEPYGTLHDPWHEEARNIEYAACVIPIILRRRFPYV